MLYFVLDLEFNQYFDFQNEFDGAYRPEPACPSEIIQMGVVVMDEGLNVTMRAETLIKPRIFTRLHPHVQRITGLNIEEFQDAPSFSEAYQEFFGFAFGKRAVFCTWGSEDIKDLYKNILFYNLNHKSLTRRYLNVQRLYGMFKGVMDGSHTVRQAGLKSAVLDMGIEAAMPFHDALCDAEYTAGVMKLLLSEKEAVPHVQFQSLNLGDLKQTISGKVNAVNINLLFAHAERIMQRKLNDRDKEAVLEVYNNGRAGRFDIHRKHS